MADFNPFAALAPVTPEGLGASRAVTFEEQSQGQSFWAREAGRAGLAARQRALESGIALSREDERAITTQSLMQGAQRRLADLVKSGSVTPMDAQEQVIRETMSGFMSAGDYNAAQSLLPALNQIQTYKLEQAKLSSEIGTEQSTQIKNIATAGREEADARLADTRGEVLAARAPAQIALDEARARKEDRLPVQPRGGSGDDRPPPTPSDFGNFQKQNLGGASAIRRLGQITELVIGTPGVGGSAAETVAKLQDQIIGATNLSKQSLPPEELAASLAVESRSGPAIAEAFKNKPKGLNVEFGRFKSLTLDLAYSLARARDPGGRLSDADVANSLAIIGAAGDARRMVAVMADLAKNTYDDLKMGRSRGDVFANDGTNQVLDSAYTEYQDLLKRLSAPKTDKKAPAPTTKEELLQRFRKPKAQ